MLSTMAAIAAIIFIIVFDAYRGNPYSRPYFVNIHKLYNVYNVEMIIDMHMRIWLTYIRKHFRKLFSY